MNRIFICATVLALGALPVALAQQQTMSHSTDSNTITVGNSVSCNSGGLHTDNGYWRSYTLANFGIVGDIIIDSITFGVEDALAAGANQPMELRLYLDPTPPAPAPMAGLNLIHTESFNLPNMALTVHTENITQPVQIQDTDTLVVCLFTPGNLGHRFFIGSNAAAETDSSYLNAAACAVVEPATCASIGFPSMHIILDVNYTPAGPPPPTCTLTAPAGTVSDDITINVDALSNAVPDDVDILLEWSDDGGVTWNVCTAAAASPNTNPTGALPSGAYDIVWDSRVDGAAVAVAGLIDLQATVTDTTAQTATCTAQVDVDNTALCQGICGDCDMGGTGPDIIDGLVAAQIGALIITPGPSQAACCDVNSDMTVSVIDALLIAQFAAQLPVTLTCL